MSTTTIQKWGNSYAVRLPKKTVERLKLRAGQTVRVEERLDGTSLSVVPVKQSVADLAGLVARITPQNRHGEIDYGKPVGKEAW